MCTALDIRGKKVDENLSLSPRPYWQRVQHAPVNSVECSLLGDPRGEYSTLPKPLLPQIAFLAPTTEEEVQCPSSELAGRRRQERK